LAALPKDAPPGDTGVSALKLAALFYPYAGPPARTHRLGWGLARPKVFACLGGRDAVVGQAAPRRALGRLQEDGLDVHILSLPDATHGFDDDKSSDPRTRFRSDLAEHALSAYVSALKTAFTADTY
jgi:dienelactone hydrolase